MKKLRKAGFEITAVHNHLLDETPSVMYMHYMGEGNAKQLATSLHDALAESKTPLGKPSSTPPDSESPAWVKAVRDSVGSQGTFKGGVVSFAIPRSNAITMNGMPHYSGPRRRRIYQFSGSRGGKGRNHWRFRAHGG
jgi:hypothetical protein